MGNQRRQTRATVVVAGAWKGRALRYPDDASIRPTAQRSRGSLFETLGGLVAGAVFADLFAGAGGVGIEAMSRGAAFVHFVETGPDALRHLRDNLEACGAAQRRFAIHARPVVELLGERPCPIGDAAIVFADPPYDSGGDEEVVASFRMEEFPALEMLVVEHRTRVRLTAPRGMNTRRERRFGDTTLTYFAPDAGAAR